MSLTQIQREFKARVGTAAQADMSRSGILASLKTAQAILESGWGSSKLAREANALFGIKADSRWAGRTHEIITRDGAGKPYTAKFRAYDSWEDSNRDHSAFLAGNPRYAAVIGERCYKKACKAIYAAGYATDPKYTDKLIGLIERHNLTCFDKNNKRDGTGMKITKDYIAPGRRNRPGRANSMNYITIHNTGNESRGAGARSHAKYFKGDAAAGRPVSYHYTVDECDIIQHLPDNEIAWHAGDGSSGRGNTQSISIGICENADGDLLGATDRAAELTAHLCRRHNIPVENIVQHHRWTGKLCPARLRAGMPYGWDAFIGKVRAHMAGKPRNAREEAPARPVSSPAPELGDRARVKQTGIPYYPGQMNIPAWVGNTVQTVDSKPMLRGGVMCVRLKEIRTWCEISNLERVEN